MENILSLAVTFALIAATIIITFKKWGVFDFYQVHRLAFMPAEVCEFCVGFWISVVLTVLMSISTESNISYIAIPFVSASLTLVIVRICER